MVSLKKILRQSIGSTASTISVPKAIPVKSNPVIQASRNSVDADSQVSIHTFFFNESNVRKSTRSTASTYSTPISPPAVVNQTSGTSRAVTTAEFLDLVHSRFFIQPYRFRFSIGCSTDRYTAASMVIAHKVGRCAGKVGLYTWNSFFSEDFSSASVDSMTDFVIGSYSLFPGMIELIVPPGVIVTYGSLLRPPESYSISCFWHGFTDLVCAWIMQSVSKNLSYGTICCRMDAEDSFRHQNLSREGEKLKFAIDSCSLDLREADHYSFLLLESLDFEVDAMLIKFGGLQVLAPGLFRDLHVTEDAALVQHSSPCFRLISLAKQQVIAIVKFWLMNSKKIAGIKTKIACSLMVLFIVAERLIKLAITHILRDVLDDKFSDNEFSMGYKLLLGAYLLNLEAQQRFL